MIAVIATALVMWILVGVMLSAAWALGVFQWEVKPTRSFAGWFVKLTLSGLQIWAIVYLARS